MFLWCSFCYAHTNNVNTRFSRLSASTAMVLLASIMASFAGPRSVSNSTWHTYQSALGITRAFTPYILKVGRSIMSWCIFLNRWLVLHVEKAFRLWVRHLNKSRRSPAGVKLGKQNLMGVEPMIAPCQNDEGEQVIPSHFVLTILNAEYLYPAIHQLLSLRV